MPIILAPIPIILGVLGVLVFATLYSLAQSALIWAVSLAIAALCYFSLRFLLNRLTRIDRMEVKFLSGAMSALMMMMTIIYFVSDNT